MSDNNYGLAGDNILDINSDPPKPLGTSRYIKLGNNQNDFSRDTFSANPVGYSFKATKNYVIKGIKIWQDSSTYTFAYSVCIGTPSVGYNAQGYNAPDVLPGDGNLRQEVDDPSTTQFDESKIWRTTMMRPTETYKEFNFTGYPFNEDSILYVRTTNNIPKNGSANVNPRIEVILTPV